MIVLRELAHAKVNLYLHVTGRRADGYHLLDSLIGFADVADKLEVMPADTLTLRLEGPYAPQLSAEDNSVLLAAQLLRKHTGIKAGAALALHKNLPVAAGLGGGSADAAAALRLLMRFWEIRLSRDELMSIALDLGADVPACLRSSTLYMGGIGEKLEVGPHLSGLSLLLANPGKPLKTAEVFAGFKPPFSSPPRHPTAFATSAACADFLRKQKNDLETPAIGLTPEIAVVIDAIGGQDGCLLARMSGSGATCFGLFADRQAAHEAAFSLGKEHSSWWIKPAVFL